MIKFTIQDLEFISEKDVEELNNVMGGLITYNYNPETNTTTISDIKNPVPTYKIDGQDTTLKYYQTQINHDTIYKIEI